MDQHIAGVASEIRDVVAHPFEHRDVIQHARISGVRVSFTAQLGEVEKAENIQPVVVRHHNHIVIAGQIFAVIGQQIVSHSRPYNRRRGSTSSPDACGWRH